MPNRAKKLKWTLIGAAVGASMSLWNVKTAGVHSASLAILALLGGYFGGDLALKSWRERLNWVVWCLAITGLHRLSMLVLDQYWPNGTTCCGTAPPRKNPNSFDAWAVTAVALIIFGFLWFKIEDRITRRQKRLEWNRFCGANRDLIERSGIPIIAIGSRDNFSDFLFRGIESVEPFQRDSSPTEISADNRQALELLAENFFAAGLFGTGLLSTVDKAERQILAHSLCSKFKPGWTISQPVPADSDPPIAAGQVPVAIAG
ncbi:hypothetical protein EON80_04975 [bacterium]|nr:MAG: hypothetical protein EON80_04975 [bacterium]